MILRELNVSDEAAFERLLDAWEGSTGFNMLYGLIEGMSFETYLKIMNEMKNGIGLTQDAVPGTSLYAFVGDEIVGKLSVRHRLNAYLERMGGHIGFGVLEKHRGKGFATLMLKEGLVYCQALGLSRVLLTCDDGNLASAAVIEKNGGVLEGLHDPKDGSSPKRRYWISL